MARKMKDSGIEWIGEIPEDWKVSLLKYSIQWKSEKGNPYATVLSLYRDYGVVPKDSRDDNHNVTSLDTSGYKCVEPGDLVINKMKAWQGSLAVSGYAGIVSPAYHVCRITDSRIDKQYLHHLLRNSAYLPEYSRLSTGMRIGQWDLGFDDFKNIPFVIPPLEEQQRIVTFLVNRLDYIESVIEQTRSSIEEYKKLKQAVITQAVTKGVRGDRPMKDSGIEWIGEIPADWACIRNVYLFKENVRTPDEDSIPLSLSQVDGLIATDDMKESSLKTSTYEGWKQVKLNDLVLNRFKGHLGVLYSATIEGMVSFHYGVYEPLRDFKSKFFEYLYHSDVYKAILGLKSNGMTVGLQNLSNQNFYSIYSLYPPETEQEEIICYLDQKCSAIDTLIEKKKQAIVELENYKKSMIYEYVTGKKEVPIC